MHQAERLVAAVHVVDDDAEPVNVDDFGERTPLLEHFLVDAVKMLLTTNDVAFDTFLGQRFFQFVGDAVDDLPLVALALLQSLLEHAVAERVQVHKP